MSNKLFFAVMISGLLFNYSYSMQLAQADRFFNEKISKLIIEQQYAGLEPVIRTFYLLGNKVQVSKIVREYSDKHGDVFALFHMCRAVCESLSTGLGLPESLDIERTQKRFMLLLVRVYTDVMACISIDEEHKEKYEEAYNFLKNYVQEKFYPQTDGIDYDFGNVRTSVLDYVDKLLQAGNLPSPIWVCYFRTSGIGEMHNCFYRDLRGNIITDTYEIFFGNVDNQAVLMCKEKAKLIDEARHNAFDKITVKICAIAETPGLTNKQKWEAFLKLNLNDI